MEQDPWDDIWHIYGSMNGQYLPILRRRCSFSIPIASMYGIFTYMWLILMVNVGKIYQSHGSVMGMKGLKVGLFTPENERMSPKKGLFQ